MKWLSCIAAIAPLMAGTIGCAADPAGHNPPAAHASQAQAEQVAAHNTLTEAEKQEGWLLLFNGENLDGWETNTGAPLRAQVDNGAIQVHPAGGPMIVYARQQFSDFIFTCEVRQENANSNSGVFFRIGDRNDPVNSSLEAQVHAPGTEMTSFGALYDLVPARVSVVRQPGHWNRMEIVARGSRVTVRVNGHVTAEINMDEWAEVGKRPDGSEHKFPVAIRDLPHEGYIGLQDHRDRVWFRNIKIRELTNDE